MRLLVLLSLAMLMLSGCADSQDDGPAKEEAISDTSRQEEEAKQDQPEPDGDGDGIPDDEEAPEAKNETGAFGYLEVNFTTNSTQVGLGEDVWFSVGVAAFTADGNATSAQPEWVIAFTDESLGTLKAGQGDQWFNHTFDEERIFVLVINATAPNFGYVTANLTITVGEPVLPPPGPEEGKETEYSCTMTIGIPSVAMNLNGAIVTKDCTIWTANQQAVVVAITTEGGCTVNADEGAVYEQGKQFVATCTGFEVQPTNSILVRTWT